MLSNNKLLGIAVYQELRKTLREVGILTKNEEGYVFTYKSNYLNHKKAISLGPELPLTRKVHKSPTLFASFQDRIPSKQNPAYTEYCKQMGISADEKDPFVLLSTIGNRGPSSFVFKAIEEDHFKAKDVHPWRQYLGLNIREFAHVFGISPNTLTQIESEKSAGETILPILRTAHDFPEVAIDFLQRQGGQIPHKKQGRALEMLWGNILSLDEIESAILAREILKATGEKDWIQKFLKNDNIKNALEYLSSQKKHDLKEIRQIKNFYFEMRFARDIHRLNGQVEYESKKLNNKKSIDFLVSNEKANMLIELTTENTNFRGETFQYCSQIDSANTLNSPEVRDLAVAQTKILEKASKFTKIILNTYNIILVDMRGFCTGVSDFGDYINILYGSKWLLNPGGEVYVQYWRSADQDEKTIQKSLFTGVFDADYESICSKNKLTNWRNLHHHVHAIGFVLERVYENGSTIKNIKIYGNPKLFTGENINEWSAEIRQKWGKILASCTFIGDLVERALLG